MLLLLLALGFVAVPRLASGGRPDVPVSDATMVHQLSADGHSMSVVVVPQRPGWNLVLLQGEDAAAGTRPDQLSPATSRPGAAGSWVLVRLPEGTSPLWIRQHGYVTALTVRTGHDPAQVDLRGPDGPECATAFLGTVLAGEPSPAACPTGRLLPADGAALRGTVGFIAARGSRAITLVQDQSPRSVAAAEAVRVAAAKSGVAVVPPERARGPVIIVSGWATAAATLHEVVAGGLRVEGAYLAPWLLSTPLLGVPAGQLVALPYAPDAEPTRRYLASLSSALSGTSPTGSGYAAWLAGQGLVDDDGTVRLYAPAIVNPRLLGGAGHDHEASQRAEWLPGGRLTAVSGPLESS